MAFVMNATSVLLVATDSLNLIAKPGGLLIVFFGDRLFKLALHAFEVAHRRALFLLRLARHRSGLAFFLGRDSGFFEYARRDVNRRLDTNSKRHRIPGPCVEQAFSDVVAEAHLGEQRALQ